MRPFIRRWLSRRLRGAVCGALAAVLGGFACQGALAQTRQPFVTENRTGAPGNIGAAAVAQSTPGMLPQVRAEPTGQWLQAAFAEAMRRPETQTQPERRELFYEGITDADAARRLTETWARYARIIRATNMKVK